MSAVTPDRPQYQAEMLELINAEITASLERQSGIRAKNRQQGHCPRRLCRGGIVVPRDQARTACSRRTGLCGIRSSSRLRDLGIRGLPVPGCPGPEQALQCVPEPLQGRHARRAHTRHARAARNGLAVSLRKSRRHLRSRRSWSARAWDVFHGPAAGLRLTRHFGAAPGVRSSILVTSASAGRESLSDGGVPGRGGTDPIPPYCSICSSAEIDL
jgi:hypothetical protein